MITWLADALRKEGCRVQEYEGWKSRGRPGDFDPYGVLLHHTGSTTSYQNPCPTLGMIVNGRPDLSGPLAQVLIGYDGICHVVAAGRANHAGTCDGDGPFPSGDGNAMLVGFEVDYSGSQPVSPEQGEAAIRGASAVLRHFGRSADYCRGHKETSTAGKWDPGRDGSSSPAYKMGEVRPMVADVLARPAGGGQDRAPAPRLPIALLAQEVATVPPDYLVQDNADHDRSGGLYACYASGLVRKIGPQERKLLDALGPDPLEVAVNTNVNAGKFLWQADSTLRGYLTTREG